MSTKIIFYKYQGTGNDFILLDNRSGQFPDIPEQEIQKMCHRQFGIGADGLIIVRNKPGYDFDMDFYNSDGRPGSMCGNGGRCLVAFAHFLGIVKEHTRFWAPDGEHEAKIVAFDYISLKMKDVNRIEKHSHGLFTNTGSPHLVIYKPLDEFGNAFNEGKAIRYSNEYSNGGTNVNFVSVQESKINIRTYERGVENLTFSCGTGNVAAALCLNFDQNIPSPIEIETDGGKLRVRFDKEGQEEYRNIWLEGPAVQVFKGEYTLS